MADGVHLDPASQRDFERFAAAMRSGDKAIAKRVRTSIREAARPIGQDVVVQGADPMPSRGGLRARLRQGQVSLRASRSGVAMTLSDRAGDKLGGLDRGTLRHRVFGRNSWVAQRVPAGSYRRALERQGPRLAARVRSGLQRALDDIAREATRGI